MKQYWLLQVTGWGLFYAIDSMLKVAAGIVSYPLFIAVFILYGFAMAASHCLRIWYRRWQRLPLLKVVAGVITASLLGAGGATSLMLGTLVVIKNPIIQQASGALDLLFINNLLVVWAVLLIWSGLYFFITRQRKVDELETTQEDLQQNLQQAQLNALLSQLNPHFMFNCINNIRALILEDAAKAREMLANLADMLRYNLQSDAGETSSLSAELAIVETYVSLMKMQYESRLAYQVTVDDKVSQDCPVPRLMLQLLVENAIKHGIARQVEGGVVSVSIGLAEHCLLIEVANPGSLKAGEGGIGVDNIRQRLAILYAEQQAFTLSQQQDKVVARVQIPYKDKPCG